MSVKTYVKRAVEIQAIEYNLDTFADVLNFTSDNEAGETMVMLNDEGEQYGLKIATLEGSIVASLGDYVIRGIEGEYYPCKPAIFDKTYQEV